MEKQIEKSVFHFCAYTTIISILFYIFAAITGIENISISIGRYFVIIGFSALITLSELIFKIEKLNKILCYIINYSVLFVAFLIVFIIINDKEFQASFVFASIIIFTVCYFIALGIIFGYNKLKTKTAKKFEKRTKKKQKENTYTPKFG